MNLSNTELVILQQMVASAVRGRTLSIETHKRFGRNVSLASQHRLDQLKILLKRLDDEIKFMK